MKSSPILLLLALSSFAQTTPTLTTTPQQQQGSTSNLTISTTKGWIDTGIDVHPGELIQITAAPANTSAPQTGSNSASTCDPNGVSDASTSNLPVSSAAGGALIGKVGDAAFDVGANKEITATQQGRLFLGVNSAGEPPCKGNFAVTLAVKPAGLAQGSIKNKLATAAQTWLGGQFGAANTGNAGSSSLSGGPSNPLAAAAAKVVTPVVAPLEPKLRDIVDKLPRRISDEFHHEGDMVNFVIIGSQADVQAALQSANWFVADTNNANAVAKAVMMTYHKQDYLQMPMSILYLFDRPQDFGYEQAEPYSVVASRHHFRGWKAADQFNGQEVWVGAGTHDIGFEKDQRNGKVTHKIDPAVDGERDHIAQTLEKTGKVKSIAYYLPPNPVQDARNATGGGYHSDGRIVVISLQPGVEIKKEQ
jgi:hypothetical protein